MGDRPNKAYDYRDMPDSLVNIDFWSKFILLSMFFSLKDDTFLAIFNMSLSLSTSTRAPASLFYNLQVLTNLSG